jgi:hypothetical protein
MAAVNKDMERRKSKKLRFLMIGNIRGREERFEREIWE